MSASIKYAYQQGHTWLYRRHYPKDVALVVGQAALKQSLKTTDARTARVRAAEVNASFEAQVEHVKQRSEAASALPGWVDAPTTALGHLWATLETSGQIKFEAKSKAPVPPVRSLGEAYLARRSNQLRPSGFKSVRYSVGLFLSKYGKLSVTELKRDHGRDFLQLVAQLSPVIGKSDRTRGLTLDQLVHFSASQTLTITARTQRRIWSQVNHFIDWIVYEGQLEANPFRSVRFDPKVRPAPYAVPTDQEVLKLLGEKDPVLQPVRRRGIPSKPTSLILSF